MRHYPEFTGVAYFPTSEEVTEAALMGFNEPDSLALGVPGAGGVSTAADLARFYQALLHNPGELWDPKWLAIASRRVEDGTSIMSPDQLGVSATACTVTRTEICGKAARKANWDFRNPFQITVSPGPALRLKSPIRKPAPISHLPD